MKSLTECLSLHHAPAFISEELVEIFNSSTYCDHSIKACSPLRKDRPVSSSRAS
jgi:hypothetical protein